MLSQNVHKDYNGKIGLNAFVTNDDIESIWSPFSKYEYPPFVLLSMTNWLMYPDNRIHSRDWFNRVAIDFTHCGRDKINTMLQTPFSNAISWMKMFEFRLKFHWIMFLKVQLTIFQHLFRKWLGVKQATSHYLNQWWHNSQTNICVTRPQRFKYI